MNKAILIGNLTRDPEITSTQGGISVCKFTVACERRYKNQQGKREADFLSCVAWRGTAEFIYKHFSRGSKIAVIGSLQSRSYDAQDGSKRYVTEIIVDEVEFASTRGDDAAPTANEPQGMTEVDNDDKLPWEG